MRNNMSIIFMLLCLTACGDEITQVYDSRAPLDKIETPLQFNGYYTEYNMIAQSSIFKIMIDGKVEYGYRINASLSDDTLVLGLEFWDRPTIVCSYDFLSKDSFVIRYAGVMFYSRNGKVTIKSGPSTGEGCHSLRAEGTFLYNY